jgi:hypothetical protein
MAVEPLSDEQKQADFVELRRAWVADPENGLFPYPEAAPDLELG